MRVTQKLCCLHAFDAGFDLTYQVFQSIAAAMGLAKPFRSRPDKLLHCKDPYERPPISVQGRLVG